MKFLNKRSLLGEFKNKLTTTEKKKRMLRYVCSVKEH